MSDLLQDLAGLVFTKGHATGNDFLLFDDPIGVSDLSDEHIAALCDRHFGFGADGVIRVVRVGATELATGDVETDRLYLMDYRNADGSYAEMCGNGVRLFVHYLIDTKKVEANEPVHVMTRGGIRTVTPVGDSHYQVDMGPSMFPGSAGKGKLEVTVTIPSLEGELTAMCIDMPNPHTVAELESLSDLKATVFPTIDPEKAPEALRPHQNPSPPAGTNFEVIVVDKDNARIDMRVCERGVGETLSCGTGCCAVAVAATKKYGNVEGEWSVHVPGGVVRVDTHGNSVLMTGPATIVGQCVVPLNVDDYMQPDEL